MYCCVSNRVYADFDVLALERQRYRDTTNCCITHRRKNPRERAKQGCESTREKDNTIVDEAIHETGKDNRWQL